MNNKLPTAKQILTSERDAYKSHANRIQNQYDNLKKQNEKLITIVKSQLELIEKLVQVNLNLSKK